MTDRLADITAHIAGVHQLGAVVNAMRGIAAARAQQARGQLAAVERYAATIAAAMAEALALVPPTRSAGTRRPARTAIVLFCAEQGFAGAFSERVLDAGGSDLATSELFLVGTRGLAAAAERSISVAWNCAFPSHSPGVPKLAGEIVTAVLDRLSAGSIGRLDAVYCQQLPGRSASVVRNRLFPVDVAAFSKSGVADPPLLNLPAADLLATLTADYLHALLCKAALNSFAAENEARMEAMAAARKQTDRQLATLQATERMVRQEQITEEIIELAAGEAASRARVGVSR